jgi:hypothetical protein
MMRELLVLNVCGGLAYSAVALLMWWAADECLGMRVAKWPAAWRPRKVGLAVELVPLAVIPLANARFALKKPRAVPPR